MHFYFNYLKKKINKYTDINIGLLTIWRLNLLYIGAVTLRTYEIEYTTRY